MNIKIENLENLIKWKKSWKNIWSRAIPHHLYKYELDKYNIAIRKWYLTISSKDRENLLNVWEKYCNINKINNIVLIKNNDLNEYRIIINWKEVEKWNNFNKEIIKKYVTNNTL